MNAFSAAQPRETGASLLAAAVFAAAFWASTAAASAALWAASAAAAFTASAARAFASASAASASACTACARALGPLNAAWPGASTSRHKGWEPRIKSNFVLGVEFKEGSSTTPHSTLHLPTPPPLHSLPARVTRPEASFASSGEGLRIRNRTSACTASPPQTIVPHPH